MVDELQFKVNSGSATEFNSLQAGGTDGIDIVDAHVPPLYLGTPGEPDFTTDPRFLVTPEVSQYDIFGIDFNMSNTFWGVSFNGGFDPTGRAENIRQGIAHLISHDGFIIQNLGGKGFPADCFAPYLQLAPPKGLGQLLCPRPSDTNSSVAQNGRIPGGMCAAGSRRFLLLIPSQEAVLALIPLGPTLTLMGLSPRGLQIFALQPTTSLPPDSQPAKVILRAF